VLFLSADTDDGNADPVFGPSPGIEPLGIAFLTLLTFLNHDG